MKRGLKPTLPVPKFKVVSPPPPLPPMRRPCQMCEQTGKLPKDETCWGCQGKGYYLSRKSNDE